MTSRQEITRRIMMALKQSCDDALYFSDDETHLIDAEYLLTVNAAKSIQCLNSSFGTPYKIYLEHSTKLISTACIPLFGKVPADNFLGHKKIIRSKNNTPKNNTARVGKVDIAVYKNKNGIDIPVCAIEIKGFNPSKGNILDDLERNSEYFSLSSATGSSLISFTVFVALHSYKKTMTNKKERANLTKIKNRYDGYIKHINLSNGIKHKIDEFTIRRGTVPEPNDPYVEEMGLEGNEDYHFIGVVICFFR